MDSVNSHHGDHSFPPNKAIGVSPVYAASCAIANHTLWSFGGRSVDENKPVLTQQTYSIDLRQNISAGLTHTRIPGPDLPIGIIDAHAAPLLNGSVLVFGGALYDTITNQWIPNEVSVESVPTGWRTSLTGDLSAVKNIPIQPCKSHNPPTNVLWLYGGRSGPGPFTDTLIQATITDSRIKVTEYNRPTDQGIAWPSKRGCGVLLQLNSTHLFLSGGLLDSNESIADWWTYSIQANTWTQGANAPNSRAGHKGVLVNDRYVFVTGGWSKFSPITSFFDMIDLYTGEAVKVDALNRGAPSPTSLSFHNAVYVNNQILIINGISSPPLDSENQQYNQNIYVVSVKSQVEQVPFGNPNPFSLVWEQSFTPGMPDKAGPSTSSEPETAGPGTLLIITLSVLGIVAAILAGIKLYSMIQKRRVSEKPRTNHPTISYAPSFTNAFPGHSLGNIDRMSQIPVYVGKSTDVYSHGINASQVLDFAPISLSFCGSGSMTSFTANGDSVCQILDVDLPDASLGIPTDILPDADAIMAE